MQIPYAVAFQHNRHISQVLFVCMGNAVLTTLYLLQMCWKLYLFSSADLLLVSYSFPRLINMDQIFCTSSLHHPISTTSQLLPSLFFHASLLRFLSSLLHPHPHWKEKDSGSIYKKVSIQIVPGAVLPESVHFRCFGKRRWGNRWKNGAGVVGTPPSAFYHSVESLTSQSLSSVFGAQLCLRFFKHVSVCEQARHPPHSMVLLQEGVCSLISPMHSQFKAWAVWLNGWQVKFKG